MDFVKEVMSLSCEEQFRIATEVAANVGYRLIAGETEESIHAKQIISRLANNGPAVVDEGDRELIGLALRMLIS